MNIPLGEKLAFQQARNAVIVAFIVGVVLSTLQITFDYFEKRSALKTTLDSLIESSVKPATESVWNLDEGLAQSVVKGLFSYANTVVASIESEKHERLAFNERALTEKSLRPLVTFLFGDEVKKEIALTVEKNRARKVIGYLIVVADPYSEGFDFIQRSALILLSGVVRSMLLALILFVVFYRSLTRPITEMATMLDRVDLTDLREGIALKQRFSSGEMRLLASKMNQLLRSFDEGSAIKDQIQQEVNTRNIDLELQVRDRTEQFRAEKERADKANKAKSLFLANISNSLRTPLTAIVGLSDVARNTQDPEKLQMYFENIRGAASTVVSMINDIVDLSQMEVNHLLLEENRFNMQVVQSDLRSIFSNEFDRKGIDFQVYIDPLLPSELVGDMGRLKQVLINLLSHSVKTVAEGFVHVHIDLIQELADEQRVVIRFKVSDSGPGVDAETVTKVLEPYYYFQQSPSEDFATSGLGLAISRRIVELMGGELQFEQESPQSSAIAFKLNMGAQQVGPESSGFSGSMTGGVLTDLSQRRVLVVEDIELNRMIVGEMLHEIGVKCDYAMNGEDAVKKVQENVFDMVLMDLQMPVMDGFEATMAIRHQLEMTMLPIVALTANVLQEDKERSLKCGMNDFIGKPVDFDELSEKVHFWVSRSPAAETEES